MVLNFDIAVIIHLTRYQQQNLLEQHLSVSAVDSVASLINQKLLPHTSTMSLQLILMINPEAFNLECPEIGFKR